MTPDATPPLVDLVLRPTHAHAAAATEAQRAAIVAAATYPASVLGSSLFGVYAILVPALGILGIGLVMRKGTSAEALPM